MPSGAKMAELGPDFSSPTLTLPAAVRIVPAMVKTETVPSLRLATSASVPALFDRYAGGALAGLEGGEHLGRGRALGADADGRLDAAEQARLQRGKVDDGELVVRDRLGRVVGAMHWLEVTAEFLLGRDGHGEGRADDAVGDLDLGQQLRLGGAQVDDGHGVRRRAFLDLDLAVDQLHLGVVGRHGELCISCGGTCPPPAAKRPQSRQ